MTIIARGETYLDEVDEVYIEAIDQIIRRTLHAVQHSADGPDGYPTRHWNEIEGVPSMVKLDVTRACHIPVSVRGRTSVADAEVEWSATIHSVERTAIGRRLIVVYALESRS